MDSHRDRLGRCGSHHRGCQKAQTNDKYETTQIGANVFYKVPVWLEEGADGKTGFELRQVEETEKTLTKAGGSLLAVGITALVGSYLWDIYHGVYVIEEKRDRARYKIGQRINLNKPSAPKTEQNPSATEPQPKSDTPTPEATDKTPEVTLVPLIDPYRLAGGLQVILTF